MFKLKDRTFRDSYMHQNKRFFYGNLESQSNYSVKNTIHLISIITRICISNYNNNKDNVMIYYINRFFLISMTCDDKNKSAWNSQHSHLNNIQVNDT